MRVGVTLPLAQDDTAEGRSPTPVQDDMDLVLESGLFDEEYYRHFRPDVPEDMPAVLHYLRHGADEGFDPSQHFSTTTYLRMYADVATNGLNPLVQAASPLLQLAGRLRTTLMTTPDLTGLRHQALEEVRSQQTEFIAGLLTQEVELNSERLEIGIVTQAKYIKETIGLMSGVPLAPSTVAATPPLTGAKAANGEERAVTAEELGRRD